MPLRISDSYAHAESPKTKKTHRKMSRNGHFQKVRRPTGLEVYNDAARILEELLEKRIDEDLRGPHKVRRNKTDPNEERIVSPGGLPATNVQRSKTMPSQYRESKDEELKQKDLEALTNIARMRRTSKGDGSLSSMDTEDNEEVGTESRRKKSLFKRLKERLIHASHRDQQVGFGKISGKDRVPSPPKKRKLKKKSGDTGSSETHRHIKAHVGEDKSIDYTEEQDYKGEDGTIHTGVHTVKKGKGSIFNSLRKKSSSPKKENGTHSAGGQTPSPSPKKSSRIHIPGSQSVAQGKAASNDLKGIPKSYPPPRQHLPTALSTDIHGNHKFNSPKPVPASGPPPPASGPPPPSSGSLVLPPPPPSSSSRSVSSSPPLHTSFPDVVVQTLGHRRANSGVYSASSSTNPSSEHTSQGSPSTTALLSTRSNVLDSPGEDIEFMDDVQYMEVDVSVVPKDNTLTTGIVENRTRGIRASGIKFHGSEGLKNLSWLAETARLQDVEIDETVVSTRRPDGDIEVTTTVNTTSTVVIPAEEDDLGDLPVYTSQKSESEKEVMYEKIAQKLIEMADSYSASMSDHESRGAAAAQPAPLSDLEKEIIKCLRSGGDRYSKHLDESLEEAKQVTKEEAYSRFQSTVQNSMGSELSWDHVAFLFYTTKGVVSAVGKGTKLANDAKEFTLKYISDTCATWIMDQGGFDSMLSSGESDFDVD